MFGIGMTEMLVIAVIALIFIGPDQLPEVARTLGRFFNDIRRSTDDIKRDFHRQSGLPRNLDDWWEPPRNSNPNFLQPPQHDPPVAQEPTASPQAPAQASEPVQTDESDKTGTKKS